MPNKDKAQILKKYKSRIMNEVSRYNDENDNFTIDEICKGMHHHSRYSLLCGSLYRALVIMCLCELNLLGKVNFYTAKQGTRLQSLTYENELYQPKFRREL